MAHFPAMEIERKIAEAAIDNGGLANFLVADAVLRNRSPGHEGRHDVPGAAIGQQAEATSLPAGTTLTLPSFGTQDVLHLPHVAARLGRARSGPNGQPDESSYPGLGGRDGLRSGNRRFDYCLAMKLCFTARQ
jgi:hypothetical protein